MSNPERIVLRHISGSRTNQVDEFPLEHVTEVVIGRDPAATVKFDPNDDLVSRQHAKIVQDAEDPTRFILTDLDSRNGTFVNKQRISGDTVLAVGDSVQLGAGGPEFSFDLDPRPAAAVKETRMAGTPEVPATRLGDAPAPTAEPASPPKTSVGRETVQRMVSDSQRRSRSSMTLIGAAIVVVIAVVAAVLLFRQLGVQRDVDDVRRTQEGSPMTAVEIAQGFGTSSVLVEFSWKLEYTPTGAQVYHRYIDSKPAYLVVGDNIEPWLITDSENNTNVPITSSGAGTGFVVTPNGFILTNRHVAANWQTSYPLPLPGKLYQRTSEGIAELGEIGDDYASDLARWVPAKAFNVDGQIVKGKLLSGTLFYLDVTFPKAKLRIPARLVRVSDRADVALIKMDLPTDVPPVELFDNYDAVQPGDPVTVLGYPGVSPDVAVRVAQVDPFNREDEWKHVPDPTVCGGLIGRVIRGEAPVGGEGVYQYWSEMGDVYQLDVQGAGPGSSGSPVYDARGRVIGIYTYGRSSREVRLSFAVPIKYGIELMGVTAVTG